MQNTEMESHEIYDETFGDVTLNFIELGDILCQLY